jgi:glyoxylase-like metal-dependent hydrolase (beta-lactamase superfamily II)
VTSAPSKYDWEKPGTFQVAPGVYRIPLPLPNDGLKAVNVYAIVEGEQVVLIDSGWALEESQRQLEQALGTIDLDLGSISRFLVTHIHRDHYSQAVAIRRLFGTRVSLGSDEVASLREIAEGGDRLPEPILQRLLAADGAELVAKLRAATAGLEPLSKQDWEDPDDWLRGGTRITVGSRELDVIETPGHTRGHVVFRDAQAGLLFAGDHVLPHITPSIGFETAASASPLATYLSSLAIIAAQQDSTLLPAHGPVTPSAHRRVEELLAHHELRLQETYDAVEAGADTGTAVAGVLRWTSRRHELADLDALNQMLATNETIAHLEVLVERGRLAAESTDGIIHYRT